MRLQELFQLLESLEFSARVNIASDPRVFRMVVRAEAPYRELVEKLSSSEDAQFEVAERTLKLADVLFDEGYEHPHDAAIATYLLALEATNSKLARSTAQTIRDLPRGWWSRIVSEHLIREGSNPARSSNACRLMVSFASSFADMRDLIDALDSATRVIAASGYLIPQLTEERHLFHGLIQTSDPVMEKYSERVAAFGPSVLEDSDDTSHRDAQAAFA